MDHKDKLEKLDLDLLIKEEYLFEKLVCPQGGNYSYDKNNDQVVCSLHGTIEQPILSNKVVEDKKEDDDSSFFEAFNDTFFDLSFTTKEAKGNILINLDIEKKDVFSFLTTKGLESISLMPEDLIFYFGSKVDSNKIREKVDFTKYALPFGGRLKQFEQMTGISLKDDVLAWIGDEFFVGITESFRENQTINIFAGIKSINDTVANNFLKKLFLLLNRSGVIVSEEKINNITVYSLGGNLIDILKISPSITIFNGIFLFALDKTILIDIINSEKKFVNSSKYDKVFNKFNKESNFNFMLFIDSDKLMENKRFNTLINQQNKDRELKFNFFEKVNLFGIYFNLIENNFEGKFKLDFNN
jgi:hypothetical protein